MSYNAKEAEKKAQLSSGTFVDFQTSPERYRHWKLNFKGDVAELCMDVDENAGLFQG